MKIGIVTDSTADISEEIRNKYNIEIVPLSVHFDDKVYRDEIDIDPPTFFNKLSQAENIPTTSMPPTANFVEKYKEMSAEYDAIISIHLSSELSGTLQSAQMASQEVSDVEIHVIDSCTISLGLAFYTLMAAKMASKGISISEILDTIKKAKENLILYFTVDDLKYIKAGGRIGKARAFLGSILNINPIITIDSVSGEVMPLDKQRGKKRTMDKMIEIGKEKLQDAKYAWIGFAHGKREKDMISFKNSLLSAIKDFNIDYKTFSTQINSTLGCHVGPNVFAGFILTGEFLKDL